MDNKQRDHFFLGFVVFTYQSLVSIQYQSWILYIGAVSGSNQTSKKLLCTTPAVAGTEIQLAIVRMLAPASWDGGLTLSYAHSLSSLLRNQAKISFYFHWCDDIWCHFIICWCWFLDYFWWLRLNADPSTRVRSLQKRPRSLKANGVVSPKPSAVSEKKNVQRSGKLLVEKLRLSKGTGERNATTCTNIWTFRILLFSADVIWWRFVTWDSLPWPTEAALHTPYHILIPKYTWLTSNNKIYLETSSKVWRVSTFYDVSKHVGVAWWSFLRSTTL